MSYVYGLGDAQESASRKFDYEHSWLDDYNQKCPKCNNKMYWVDFDQEWYEDGDMDLNIDWECDNCGNTLSKHY